MFASSCNTNIITSTLTIDRRQSQNSLLKRTMHNQSSAIHDEPLSRHKNTNTGELYTAAG